MFDTGGQPLVSRLGSRHSLAGVLDCDDVRWCAHGRSDVVDRSHLRHTFAVTFLTTRKSGRELVLAVRSSTGSRLTQCVRAHHDSFAVGGQDHYVSLWARSRLAGGIEVIDIGRCAYCKLLDLAFPHSAPCRPLDRIDGRSIGTG